MEVTDILALTTDPTIVATVDTIKHIADGLWLGAFTCCVIGCGVSAFRGSFLGWCAWFSFGWFCLSSLGG